MSDRQVAAAGEAAAPFPGCAHAMYSGLCAFGLVLLPGRLRVVAVGTDPVSFTFDPEKATLRQEGFPAVRNLELSPVQRALKLLGSDMNAVVSGVTSAVE